MPVKGLLDLLDSLALLVSRETTGFHAQIMGPAGERSAYAEQCYARCTELGLDPFVSFLGPQKVDDVIDGIDVFLLPSHNEGQPMTVLEAMTVGIPVVGTEVGGMRQVALDPLPSADGPLGSCGILVQPHDVVGFADALQTVLADPAAYRQMQRNARARVASTFQLADAMQLYRDLYAELLGDTAAPAASEAAVGGLTVVVGEAGPPEAAGRLVLEPAASGARRVLDLVELERGRRAGDPDLDLDFEPETLEEEHR